MKIRKVHLISVMIIGYGIMILCVSYGIQSLLLTWLPAFIGMIALIMLWYGYYEK